MAAPLSPPRLLPSGDSAITVEFSRKIDDEANRRVLALDRLMAQQPIAGVTETIPTYRSLLVHYDPTQIDFATLGKKLVELAQRPVPASEKARLWRIPVAYGGEYGIDLEDVAKTLNTTPDDIVARHVAGEYRVAMIGFTPGWSYLSGLHESLHMSRRKDPRLLTPAGTSRSAACRPAFNASRVRAAGICWAARRCEPINCIVSRPSCSSLAIA